MVQRLTDSQQPLLTAPYAGRLGLPRVGHTLATFARRYPVGMVATLVLAMICLIALGGGIWTVIIAIAVTRLPFGVRVIRSVTLALKELTYVDAARAVGASDLRIMARHIVPQCIPSFLVLATAHLGTAIVIEAGLGFLGIGITPPTASWGNMLGGVVANTYKPLWWLVVFPGLAISLTVLAVNLLGDALRDILDPKMRGW